MDNNMLRCAAIAAGRAGDPIRPEWIYAQWVHESTNITEGDPDYGQPFKSPLAKAANNFGGVCQKEETPYPQPDGDEYYMVFETVEAYATYFGGYIRYFDVDGVYNSQNVTDYITALHHGGYFTDDPDAYVSDVVRILGEEFPGVA